MENTRHTPTSLLESVSHTGAPGWRSINDVAAFIGTYPFRGAVPNEPGGDVAVVQLKDACQTDVEIGSAMPRITSPERKFDRYFLEPGDVLIQARGRHLAGIVHLQDRAIAAPGLHVLRPDGNRITPIYLAWCLNHPKTQAMIAEVAQGTHAPFIAKQTLLDLRIPVPPIEAQHRIADVIRAHEHERELATQRIATQDAFVNGKAWEAVVAAAQELV